MAKIFITGSADGLGQLAAISLIQIGHKVVLHARNQKRADDTHRKLPEVEDILIGDLSDINQTVRLAEDVNELGNFDAVIHNAGVYRARADEIFHVNILAPYLLTCLIQKPQRLVYLSSGSHYSGHANPDNFINHINLINYSDSKLYDLMLAIAAARHWTSVFSNAVDPGWVPTKMGGAGAPDNLQKGYETQVWLAISEDKDSKVSGKYFKHKKQKTHNPEASDISLQEKFLSTCEKVTGIKFPK